MENKLNILWTNDNVITVENMLFMYGINSKKMKLWDNVNVIIWGAATKLVGENAHIRELIKNAQEVGVNFMACLACAEELEVKNVLADLGIDVKYMANPLTDIIKSKENLLTI